MIQAITSWYLNPHIFKHMLARGSRFLPKNLLSQEFVFWPDPLSTLPLARPILHRCHTTIAYASRLWFICLIIYNCLSFSFPSPTILIIGCDHGIKWRRGWKMWSYMAPAVAKEKKEAWKLISEEYSSAIIKHFPDTSSWNFYKT